MAAATGIGNPICLALDVPDAETALALAARARDQVGVFKVGLTAFVGAGLGIVGRLSPLRPVFVDLKLHDIPEQVGHATAAVAASGAAYTTVHASGGPEMIAAAARAAGDTEVLAVTVLTSLGAGDLARLGIAGTVGDAVTRLADVALEAGADGLVCSPQEVEALRRRFGARAEGGPVLVVPGIRPNGSKVDDQRRVGSARAALDAGADLLVVGRPITASADPGGAARRMAEGLQA